MAILLLLLVLGLGAAALLGRTADSRDADFGLSRLVGRTPTAAEPVEDPDPEPAVLTVPAAWLSVPQVAGR